MEDWNYDRIVMAQAQINDATGDMMRVLHRGEVSSVVRDRMVALLRSAADDIEKMGTGCGNSAQEWGK